MKRYALIGICFLLCLLLPFSAFAETANDKLGYGQTDEDVSDLYGDVQEDEMLTAPDIVLRVGISLVIGFGIALTVALLLRRQMNTVRKQKRADTYSENGLRLTEQRDIYLYSTVTRVRVNNSNNKR